MQQIDIRGSLDVRLFEQRPATGQFQPLRRRRLELVRQLRGAFDDAKLGRVEVCREPVAIDEVVLLREIHERNFR